MIEFREARAEDDAQLTKLVCQPMPGDLSLAFCREPSYLASCAHCGPPRRVLAAADGDRVVAVCSFFLREYHWNGQPRAVWTLSDFRALSSKAGLSITGQGWKSIRRFLGGLPAMLSVIEDNRRALGLFAKKRPNWPTLRPLGQLCTNIQPLLQWPAACTAYQVRPIEPEAVVQFHNGQARPLSPLVEGADFGAVLPSASRFWGVFDRDGVLRGCAGLSEPHAYRQVRIHGYAGLYRKLYRLGQACGVGLLPEPGSQVPLSTATLLDCPEPAPFRSLFARLKAEARQAGSSFLVWCRGGTDHTRLLDRFRFCYSSRLYQVLWEGDQPLPALSGPIHPEVAWL